VELFQPLSCSIWRYQLVSRHCRFEVFGACRSHSAASISEASSTIHSNAQDVDRVGKGIKFYVALMNNPAFAQRILQYCIVDVAPFKFCGFKVLTIHTDTLWELRDTHCTGVDGPATLAVINPCQTQARPIVRCTVWCFAGATMGLGQFDRRTSIVSGHCNV